MGHTTFTELFAGLAKICERTKNISNGYASLYFLLEGLKRDFPEYTIPFNPHLIYDRIISSDAWDALMENEYYYNIHRGLLNGFPGTVLALLNIKQRYLCE